MTPGPFIKQVQQPVRRCARPLSIVALAFLMGGVAPVSQFVFSAIERLRDSDATHEARARAVEMGAQPAKAEAAE